MKKVAVLLSLFFAMMISPPAVMGLSARDSPSTVLVNHRDRCWGWWGDDWGGRHGHHHGGHGHHGGGHHGHHGGHHGGHGHH